MRLRSTVTGILLLAPLVGQAPEDPERALQRLIEEIDSLGSAEPPILGIDTQIRAAAVLQPKRPKDAQPILAGALARIHGLADSPTRERFVVEAVRVASKMDPVAAEAECGLLPRRGAGRAACFNEVIESYGRDWRRRMEAAQRALAAGAMTASALRGMLDTATRDHPEDFPPLYQALIDALPEDASTAEVDSLLGYVRRSGEHQPALSRAALEKALRAVMERDFGRETKEQGATVRAGQTSLRLRNARELRMLRITDLAERLAPELADLYRERFKRYREFLDKIPPGTGREWRLDDKEESAGEEKTEVEKEPDISGLDFEAALALARRQESPLARVSLLLDLMDRENAPEDTRGRLATEALEASTRLAPDDSRLIAQSMLTRRLWVFGEKQMAGKAAAALEESFELLCRCRDFTCDMIKGREECAERVMDFAEYLKQNGLTPEQLGLTHRSLRARMLLLELDERVNGKKKRGLFQ